MIKQNCSWGCDTLHPLPETVSESACGVCGAVCEVKRNVNGYLSYAAAMTKKKRLHDYFFCPHREDPEHKKARALIAEMKQTNSPSLKKIMQGDLDIMISHIRHNPTKKMMEAIDEGMKNARKILKEREE